MVVQALKTIHVKDVQKAHQPETIAKIQDIVLEDRLTKRNLVEALHISLGSVSEILGFRKLCAQWVPHSLTMEQKHIRMRLSQQHLERFKKDKVDFVRRFITMDETWVYHHDPESKQEAKEWCELGFRLRNEFVSGNRPRRLWHQFFGMRKEFCLWITCKLVKQLIPNIIANFWTS